MAELSGRVASIQVGRPQIRGDDAAADPWDRRWFSAFCKDPATGPLALRRLNLEGDAQADLENHGGVDKAVLAYAASHYPAWRREPGMPDFPFGGFGENFTVEGLAEPDFCIGDVWKIGTAVVQVSQPRQPCWKLARRWKIKTLALQVQKNGRTGWYFRVLTEGIVAPGEPIALVERPNPRWDVARCNRLMHIDKTDFTAAAELAALPELSASWKRTLTNRVEKNLEPNERLRLDGAG